MMTEKGCRNLRASIAFSVIVAVSLLLNTCNLFKPGLGEKVDITAPVVTISAPQQNSYIKGTMTIQGAASDDLSLASLSVSYPGPAGQVTKSITVANGSWSFDIPTGPGGAENLPDGEQHIVVTAKDGSGKESQAELIAYIDNTPPTVLLTVPQGYGTSKPTTSDYIDIKGEVWDRSPVTEVNVSVFNTSGSVMETRHADGTNTWSTRFLTTGYTASATDPYTYSVEAKDKAGNANTYYYHSADIWALLTTYGGTLFPATDEIGKVDQDKSGAAGVIPYADLYGHRLGYPGGSYGDFYKTDDATLPVINFSNLDLANPIQDNVIGTKVPINGYINPGPALNTVLAGTLKAWIIPWSDPPVWPGTPNVNNPPDVIATGISSSVSFQIEPKILGTYISSGRYLIRVDAGASGTSSVASEVCGFIVDSGAPRVEAVQPADLSLVRRKIFAAGTPLAGQEGIEIRVNLQDDNSAQLSTAVAALTNGGPALPGIAWDGVSGPDTWYIIQVPLGAGKSEIWFELEGKDDVNMPARKTVHYTIDETAPTVVIVSPSDGSWVTGNSTTVSGTSSDNTGLVSTIYLWLGLSSATPPADITTWNSLTGNASWVTTLPLGGEGAYTVRAVAVDFADNQSSIGTRTFTLDQSNPTLTETSTGSGTILRNAGFTLSGTAADTNALSSITITEKKNGGTPTTVLSLSPSGTSQVYTYNKAVNAGTHADDGTYEYTITTTDAAGKTAPSITRTVIVDTEAPLLVLEGFTSGYNSALSQVNGIVVYKFSADGGIVSVEKSGSDYVGHF
ncbi:MAG: Ig-like domain repeat protein, partial [Spirochaetes bacterium]|nr:Ig-like domain repeat protein [Spirochaetota bacterium]